MRQLHGIIFCNILGVFARTPTAYNCDILRQHGILTPGCKARYIVNEGKEPLVIDNDEDIGRVELKQRRAPLRRHEVQLVDSNDCPTDNNDGNWLLNLFSNLYRQFVMCDALKLKQLSHFKPLPAIDFDTNDLQPQIRRAPTRKLPEPLRPLNPPNAKIPKPKAQQLKPKNSRQHTSKKIQKLKTKKGQLSERYRNVETIKYRDPLEEFHAVEQQKRINQKLKVQPTLLAQSSFHSQAV